MSKDYYKILGVDKTASKDDIKKAFRKLAHQHHPDKGGDEAKFKEINEAYQTLSDDSKRAQYDQFGASGGPGAGGFDFSQGFDFGGFGQGGVQFDLGDLFGDFFGGGRGRAQRGRDISVDIQISLSEAVFGVDRTVLISKVGTCETCSGNGAEPGSKTKSCGNCGGSGRIHDTKTTMFGTFTTAKTCDRCHGRGQVPEKECKSCGGRGIKPKQESIDIKVPAGIENGEMIRLSGRGEAVSQGVAGDLYVKVHVAAHPTIRREGSHLLTDLKIKLTDAVLGTEHRIETLDGETTIKILAGINSGEMLRIRGRGVPGRAGKRGDFLVRVIIPTPTKLSKATTDLFKKLQDEGI